MRPRRARRGTPCCPGDAATPAEELLARRLLVPAAAAWCASRARWGWRCAAVARRREPVDDRAASVATSDARPALVDRAAAGAAFDVVRRVELLLDHWGAAPPGALRSGGLAVRDLKAAAALLHVDEAAAALLVEVAAAAGLLTTGADADGNRSWLPTDAFDAWCAARRADRWARWRAAWLETEPGARPGRRARRGRQGAATRSAPELSSGIARRDAARWRWPRSPSCRRRGAGHRHRRAVAGRAGGLAAAAAAARRGPTRWSRRSTRRPRSASSGSAGCPRAGRPLLAGEDAEAAGPLTPLLPDPVDHVLIQADLTAVAPGPLEARARARGCSCSPTSSRAAGRRSTASPPASVRRAFDAGWSAWRCTSSSASVSRTPVPQPLTYLVDDAARTFGTVRVGHAEAFLRADDETALSRAAAPPEGRLRSGCAGSPRPCWSSTTPIDVLLPRLRELGAAPVVEAADGTVHVARPDRSGPATRGTARRPTCRAARESAHVAQVVTAIRAGDRATVVPAGDAAPRRSRRSARSPRCARRSRPARPC